MKNISVGLKSAIDSGEICFLYRIEARDGTIRRFTDHDQQVIVLGETYIPSAGVGRIRMRSTNNAEVSNQEMAATIVDMPENELDSGKWDAAQIEISICGWRAQAEGKLIVFKGSLGVIQWTDEGFRADIHNYLRDLGKNIGNTVTANCRHELYSQQQPGKIGFCGVDKSSFTTNVTVDSILTGKLKFKINTSGRPNDWASAGFIKFTSGTLNGITYEVKKHTVEGGALGEAVELFLPTIAQIVPGTTAELIGGCDKTLATCKAKFNNVVQFGGFPHLQVDVNLRFEGG